MGGRRRSFAAFDAGDVPAGSADISIAWRAGFSAVSAAAALGDPRSSLVMMLAAENVAHVRSASGTLSPDGACLALRLRVVADAATSGGAQRISRAIALAETKARDALSDATNDLATPSDAAAAAEQASLVALAPDTVATIEPYVVVGASGATNETRESLAKALADATRAWTSPIVESRSRIERGQPAAWMLVASPCGTAGEADTDAGSSAAFAVAASNAARAHGVASEPWIAGDGVGVLASAPSARLLADALARTVLVEPLEGVRAAQGLLHDAARPGLAGLALALAPGRPASIVPTGTPLSLLRVSEPAILARAESLRHGPLRVALLDNDESTADAAIARVDRWVLREGARACPAQAAIAPPKPGTYAVATDDGTSEAYLALAIPAQYEAEASVIAGVLDRDLLAKALSDGLARESSARVLGPAGGRALVIHVEAPASALDAAVAQTRALLDRVRQGAIAEADLARHSARVREESAVKMRDPRERLIALFRGEPARADVGLDRVRTAAAAFVHDDALVIVAARPRTKRTP